MNLETLYLFFNRIWVAIMQILGRRQTGYVSDFGKNNTSPQIITAPSIVTTVYNWLAGANSFLNGVVVDDAVFGHNVAHLIGASKGITIPVPTLNGTYTMKFRRGTNQGELKIRLGADTSTNYIFMSLMGYGQYYLGSVRDGVFSQVKGWTNYSLTDDIGIIKFVVKDLHFQLFFNDNLLFEADLPHVPSSCDALRLENMYDNDIFIDEITVTQ